MTVTIFDLDGCLSDDRHRRHLLPGPNAHTHDYEQYHGECNKDIAVHHNVVTGAAQRGSIILVTGRSQNQWDKTAAWFKTHFGVDPTAILMRPDNNYQRAPDLKVSLLSDFGVSPSDVSAAYDDREDVLDGYRKWGVPINHLHKMRVEDYEHPSTAADVLQNMADTFRIRQRQYADNWRMVPEVIKVLFPDGVPSELVTRPEWHLFELKIVKLTRFAISNLTHVDSIHDDAVYSAMIEHIINNEER